MTAGALTPFELDQINSSGDSHVQLYWSSPSTPRALVPQSQLYPPAAEPMHGANVVYADCRRERLAGRAGHRVELARP